MSVGSRVMRFILVGFSFFGALTMSLVNMSDNVRATETANGNSVSRSFSFKRTRLFKTAEIRFFASTNSTIWTTQELNPALYSVVQNPLPVNEIVYQNNVTIWQTSSENRYVMGQCTWYVYNRRAELGLKTGSLWGDAGNWQYYAAAAGWTVDNIPSIGAVIEWPGHVAVVEKIDWENNRVYISEMNYLWAFNYHEAWVENADQQIYIH
jgi:surface antigen